MNTEPTVFSKIINREIPATFLYESDRVIVIENIHPAAPVHILGITKQPFFNLDELLQDADNKETLWELFAALRTVAADKGITESGYKLVSNCGPDANQAVPHLHVHLLGGKRLVDGT